MNMLLQRINLLKNIHHNSYTQNTGKQFVARKFTRWIKSEWYFLTMFGLGVIFVPSNAWCDMNSDWEYQQRQLEVQQAELEAQQRLAEQQRQEEEQRLAEQQRQEEQRLAEQQRQEEQQGGGGGGGGGGSGGSGSSGGDSRGFAR